MNKEILKMARALFEQIRLIKDTDMVVPAAFGFREDAFMVATLPKDQVAWPAVFKFLASDRKAVMHVFEGWRVGGGPKDGFSPDPPKDALVGILWTPEDTVVLESLILARPRKGGRRTGRVRVIESDELTSAGNPYKDSVNDPGLTVGMSFMSPTEGNA